MSYLTAVNSVRGAPAACQLCQCVYSATLQRCLQCETQLFAWLLCIYSIPMRSSELFAVLFIRERGKEIRDLLDKLGN